MNKYISYAILLVICVAMIVIIRLSISTINTDPNTVLVPTHQDIATSSEVSSVPQNPNSPRTQDFREEMDVFEHVDVNRNTSNVVGYLGAGGVFVMYVPDWIVDHWRSDSGDGDTFTFSPRDNIDQKDFSDIVIAMQSSTEQFNAETLYSSDSASKNGLILSEVFLNKEGDMRIYHVQRNDGDMIGDTFYLDGNGKTAKVMFYSDSFANSVAGPKVREFIQGFGRGSGPQG